MDLLEHPDKLGDLRNKALSNSDYYTVGNVKSRLFKTLPPPAKSESVPGVNSVRPYKMCSRCVMDTNDDANITFDEKNRCNYCSAYFDQKGNDGTPEQLKTELENIIQNVKNNRGNAKYDCIVGVSGGADSMYVVHLLAGYGLNPLVVHYDNGWDSELAVKNIEVIINKLNLDLYTYVNDWEEFKDIQMAFIKANVIDIELITDQAIIAVLYKLSQKFDLKYIFTGHNTSTEFILPKHWYHWKLDGLNIKAIHKRFGKRKLKTYPIVSYFDQYYLNKTGKFKQCSILNYLEYNKEKAKELLKNEYGWVDYTGKHNESIFTRFYQNYILPLKFNVDKRKAHLSSLICSGQITRDHALKELSIKSWETQQTIDDKQYVIKKLDWNEKDFDAWIREKPVSHFAYPSYLTRHEKIVQKLRALLGRK
jgi:N-acetyl sugar amidotransferase